LEKALLDVKARDPRATSHYHFCSLLTPKPLYGGHLLNVCCIFCHYKSELLFQSKDYFKTLVKFDQVVFGKVAMW
jgi:hypothetical protein